MSDSLSALNKETNLNKKKGRKKRKTIETFVAFLLKEENCSKTGKEKERRIETDIMDSHS